ncbi:lipoate--protein ligase family protein [Priestia taiwanensis]|uniref:Octanoyl-[GcvH]:protein N-octanoyltransferase n=1 Tax=Priestia taiwanensis TaxID=1347902 RepID=A0A917EU30_9BACI|nr:biotin/lipoate A/B protein ligase family protein [Priestia taiwanensis]MBM7364938.1 octanoyl-[GcvH]:protein N-octanoyltransferase [Priestia taiwanensis]GGE82365.1 octanoyl-[GcvH]:protein N-octanoyltransferase [Priestia taiwanensis]
MNKSTLLHQEAWRFIDQSTLGPLFHGIQSFAMDDTLCTSVGNGTSHATCRTWVHHNTVVLGIQDTKLPYLEDGVTFLKEQGYNVIVRNSGGLAVVLDEGVLNISLILPEAERSIDIDAGYDAMWQLIQDMFADFDVNIEAKEIVGSYCPGSYDLSIRDQKFAGISQRRIRKGIAVQIYLCIDNSGAERAALIQHFYEKALKGTETKFEYPTIVPKTMASLSELTNTNLTVADVMLRLMKTLHGYGGALQPEGLTEEEHTLYEHHLKRMIDRNEKALGSLFSTYR